MPKFDLTSFSNSVAGGQDILGALDVQYGVPSCAMRLGRDLLSLLPTNVLGGMRNDMAIGRNAADAVTKAVSQKIRNLTGIVEFDTDEGVFRFVSDSSQYGQEQGSLAGALGEWVGLAQQAIAFGSQLYSNVNSAIESVEELAECMSEFEAFLEGVNGESAAADTPGSTAAQSRLNAYAVEIEKSNRAKAFIEDVTATINDIDSIIAERINDPTLEPSLIEDPVDPSKESVFRLDVGPPKSKSGQFLLSIDGLYYDSQVSGVAPALLELSLREGERDPSLDWKLEFDPSLGGRGAPETVNDLNQYFNTIFDPDIIDDSSYMQEFYDADNTVVNILGQRNRKIFDVSAEIQQHTDAGSSKVIIDNLKQVMISESSRFMDQLRRRKKQIELAVKMPRLYGKGQLFQPGEVPINDFSYLAGINYRLDLNKQRSIVIRQDEVKGIVLPIETKFSEVIEVKDGVTFGHLLLDQIPDGITIDSANASASTSASIAAIPKLVDDGLFALYNYLTLKASDPSGNDYGLRNSTPAGISYNAQLVGDTPRILDKGLGIAYLDGICKLDSTSSVSAVGSFVKLPALQEFQDLLYSRGGATFESWVYTPELSSTSYYDQDSDVSGLYRLILANENVGRDDIAKKQDDILNISLDNGVGICRGMILGFSRDRRFTHNTVPSNLQEDNPVQDVALIVAPTQSFDSSSAGFIAEKLETATCESASSYKGMVIPVSSTYNDVSLSSCASSFCHLSVTFNPIRDEVSVYLDGVNLTTSSYESVFGVNSRKRTPQIPSISPDNSFEYIESKVGSESLEALKKGPLKDDYFTPWILGGGYSDGNPDGGFMGGEYGGKVSGLRGYLGCTRFYSKPLNSSEILNNYNATKNFFKNIKL